MYCEGNIIKHDIESCGSSGKIFSNQSCYILTLSNELTRVELSYHTLEDFVDDRWEDTLIVVCAKCPVDLWESIDERTREDTACYINHLQVFCAGQGCNVSRFGADIVGYGCFEPGDLEMSS